MQTWEPWTRPINHRHNQSLAVLYASVQVQHAGADRVTLKSLRGSRLNTRYCLSLIALCVEV